MKMPLVLRLIVVTAWASLVYRGLLVALGLFGLVSPSSQQGVQLLGISVVSALAAAYAWVVIRTVRLRPPRAYLIVALYPVFGLVLYPVENLLPSTGLYPPRVQVAPQGAAGAALAEILRYLWFISLFVWFRLSKRSRAYLAPKVESASAPIVAGA